MKNDPATRAMMEHFVSNGIITRIFSILQKKKKKQKKTSLLKCGLRQLAKKENSTIVSTV